VASPLIIGPDSESEQWVSAVAKDADAPHSVLEKIRHGDRDVEISVRTLPDLTGRTPVLVDDIMHRYGSLSEIYRIPARVVPAAPFAPYEFNLC
jgi:ribose-phosphate pyrophosphokinase